MPNWTWRPRAASGVFPAQDAQRGLVEQDLVFIRPVIQRTGKSPPCQQFQTQRLYVTGCDDNALQVVLDLVRIFDAPGRLGGDIPDIPRQAGQVDALAHTGYPAVPEQVFLPGLVFVGHLRDRGDGDHLLPFEAQVLVLYIPVSG